MEKEIEYQALIDKFLRAEPFSKAEQKDWDSWQQDRDFADLLTYNHDLLIVLKQKGREDLKQELEGLIALHQKAEGSIRSMRMMWVAVAAAAAICLIWLILPLKQTTSPTELYASHYERFPNVANPLTRDSGAQTTLKDRAYAKYEQGGYHQAIVLFDSLIEQEPSLTHQFYQGICAMEQNDWQLARKVLEPVRTSDTSRFAKPAQWYMALVALQTNQIELAKSLLSEIKEDNTHPYTKEANTILESLE